MSFPVQHRPVSIRPMVLTLLSATSLFRDCHLQRKRPRFRDGRRRQLQHHGARAGHRPASGRAQQIRTDVVAPFTIADGDPKGDQDANKDATQSTGSAVDTPEQIETFKRNRRAYVGSSGLVLPTPLPGPTHYAPIGTGAGVAVNPLPREQPPTILPGSGRAIPNLPHGPETFQDRASRCAFQSSINSIPGSQASSYMHSCAM